MPLLAECHLIQDESSGTPDLGYRAGCPFIHSCLVIEMQHADV